MLNHHLVWLYRYYYRPVPISEENLLLMRFLDEQYTRTLYYGKRKMVVYLQEQG
jgi:putative transposase